MKSKLRNPEHDIYTYIYLEYKKNTLHENPIAMQLHSIALQYFD